MTETLIEFPCEFSIKIIGKSEDDISTLVYTLAVQHFTDLRDHVIQERPSKNGTYTAVTITVAVNNKDQLDGFYRVLSAEKRFVMVL